MFLHLIRCCRKPCYINIIWRLRNASGDFNFCRIFFLFYVKILNEKEWTFGFWHLNWERTHWRIFLTWRIWIACECIFVCVYLCMCVCNRKYISFKTTCTTSSLWSLFWNVLGMSRSDSNCIQLINIVSHNCIVSVSNIFRTFRF